MFEQIYVSGNIFIPDIIKNISLDNIKNLYILLPLKASDTFVNVLDGTKLRKKSKFIILTFK